MKQNLTLWDVARLFRDAARDGLRRLRDACNPPATIG